MDQKLSTPKAADLIGVSPKTLYNWRKEGIGPDFFQPAPGCDVKYDREEVLRWMDSRTRNKRCETA